MNELIQVLQEGECEYPLSIILALKKFKLLKRDKQKFIFQTLEDCIIENDDDKSYMAFQNAIICYELEGTSIADEYNDTMFNIRLVELKEVQEVERKSFEESNEKEYQHIQADIWKEYIRDHQKIIVEFNKSVENIDNTKTINCPVMLSAIESPFIMPCGHIFDVQSIYNLPVRHNNIRCPLCRKECNYRDQASLNVYLQ